MTGIPKILRELKKNGSPEPEFEIDDDRTYLNTIIRMRDNFNQKNERNLSEVLSGVLSSKDYNKVTAIIEFLEQNGEITPRIAESICGKSPATV